MKVKGSIARLDIQEVEYSVKTSYKEPTLHISVDGVTLADVAIEAVMVPSASGANDTLVLTVALGNDKLTKTVHIPTLLAESEPAQEIPDVPASEILEQ